MSCFALFCFVAATVAGATGLAAVAAAYLPTTELRALQGAHAAVVTGRAIGVTIAYVLEANGQRSPCRALFRLYPSLYLYLWLVALL